jgi:hypothetical protein
VFARTTSSWWAERIPWYPPYAEKTKDSTVRKEKKNLSKFWFNFMSVILTVYLNVPAPVSDILLSFKFGNDLIPDLEWRIKIAMLACTDYSLLGNYKLSGNIYYTFVNVISRLMQHLLVVFNISPFHREQCIRSTGQTQPITALANLPIKTITFASEGK